MRKMLSGFGKIFTNLVLEIIGLPPHEKVKGRVNDAFWSDLSFWFIHVYAARKTLKTLSRQGFQVN